MQSGNAAENGFILVFTLWFLAAITLAAGYFANWSQDKLAKVQTSVQELEDQKDMLSTRSTLLFLWTTQEFNNAGLVLPESKDEQSKRDEKKDKGRPLGSSMPPITGDELHLDGTVYQGVGRIRFSLQDKAGLMGLNGVSRENMSELLGLKGVSSSERGPMVDKLLDYVDSDSYIRLNGAEKDAYLEEGLEPPPNRRLITSWELRKVMGWKHAASLWSHPVLPRLTSAVSGGSLNINTAPLLILQAQGGFTQRQALKIISSREKKSLQA